MTSDLDPNVCEEMGWAVQLKWPEMSGRPTDAVIEESPITPSPVPWNDVTERPVYVMFRGRDRYCAYPVKGTPFETNSAPRQEGYGRLANFKGTQHHAFPVGVLIDANETAYAPVVHEKTWSLVGDPATTKLHVKTLWDIVDRLAVAEKLRSQSPIKQPAHETSPTRSNLPDISKEQADRSLTELLDWMATAPEGSPALAALLSGPEIVYAPKELNRFTNVYALYDPVSDQILVSSSLIDKIQRGKYSTVRSELRHELAHEESHDRGWPSPFEQQIRSAVFLYSNTVYCAEEGRCGLRSYLLPNEERAMAENFLRQGKSAPIIDIPEEGIAFSAQLEDAHWLPPSVRVPLEAHYGDLRDYFYSGMSSGSLPPSVFRLSRDYFIDGLNAIISPNGEFPDRVQSHLKVYDQYLACAEGDLSQCSSRPDIILLP